MRVILKLITWLQWAIENKVVYIKIIFKVILKYRK